VDQKIHNISLMDMGGVEPPCWDNFDNDIYTFIWS